METLLVIDDEAGVRIAIQEVLQSNALRVITAEDSESGLRSMREEFPNIVLLDIRLGNESGIDIFHQLREVDPKALVVFITGHGTTDTAIEAMKLGAFDYLLKPLDFDQLEHVVSQGLKISRLMRNPTAVGTTEGDVESSDRLIGSGPAMQAICKQIGRIAPQNVNVLILGESGTGKELVARAIYHHSRRNQSPFLAINCAAIPDTLLESELFGHEKGAFTGAEQRRIGKFEQCHLGTIFLDEVGDMPLTTQAKILRLLQEGQFQRVGGNDTLTADVRILAASNQPIEAMIKEGTFRRDLYYRLRGVTLHLPPLRERLEDIPELAHYFLFRFSRQFGSVVQSISPESLDKLRQYTWPGNVRQLQSVIREALIVATGPELLPEFLPLEFQQDSINEDGAEADYGLVGDDMWQSLREFIEDSLAEKQPDVYRQALLRFDRLILGEAMKQATGLQFRAAELLGISRPTLRAKLRSLLTDTAVESHHTDEAS
jgi:two-component system, NtrC family, nitrogen regulation response regulator GlnG